MGEFDGKVALVTGSDQGIGRATAIELAMRGARVVITCRPKRDSEKRAHDVCDSILEKTGRLPLFRAADLVDEGEVNNLFYGVQHNYGKLDILVNSAAMAKWRSMETIDLEDLDYSYKVNVRAPLQLTKLFYPSMKNGGRIVNVSSCGTHVVFPSSVDYTAVKSALEGMTKAQALDLKRLNIMVNAICPGLTDTRSLRIILRRPGMAQWIEWLKANFRRDVIMSPEEVAHQIVELCSFNSYETGKIKLFDKGLVEFLQTHPEAMEKFYTLTG